MILWSSVKHRPIISKDHFLSKVLQKVVSAAFLTNSNQFSPHSTAEASLLKSQKDKRHGRRLKTNKHPGLLVDSPLSVWLTEAKSFTPAISKLSRHWPCCYADDAELYPPVKPDHLKPSFSLTLRQLISRLSYLPLQDNLPINVKSAARNYYKLARYIYGTKCLMFLPQLKCLVQISSYISPQKSHQPCISLNALNVVLILGWAG